jgi:hypothetical protein
MVCIVNEKCEVTPAVIGAQKMNERMKECLNVRMKNAWSGGGDANVY